MSRKSDLEENILESYGIISECESTVRTSTDLQQKANLQRIVQEQWALIERYWQEYRLLAGSHMPDAVAQIVTRFDVSFSSESPPKQSLVFPVDQDEQAGRASAPRQAVTRIFHGAGGPVSPEDPTYVERKTDREALGILEGGDFCHIVAPRQMGKTSLLYWLKSKLVQRGWRIAYCDLASIQNVQEATWYRSLGRTVFPQLGWSEAPLIANAQDFKSGLVELLARDALPRPIALFFDEVEGANNLDFTAPFFSTLRAMHGLPIDFPVLERVMCAFACRMNPTKLIKDPDVSPFNVGRRVSLDDFTQSEVQRLTKQLTVDTSRVAPSLDERLYYWTAGHPYLTQRICSEIENRGQPVTEQDIDRVVAYLFFDVHGPDKNSNISHITLQTEGYRGLLARVLNGDPVRRTEPVIETLCEIGAVKTGTDNLHVVIRNRIYEQALGGSLQSDTLACEQEASDSTGGPEILASVTKLSSILGSKTVYLLWIMPFSFVVFALSTAIGLFFHFDFLLWPAAISFILLVMSVGSYIYVLSKEGKKGE